MKKNKVIETLIKVDELIQEERIVMSPGDRRFKSFPCVSIDPAIIGQCFESARQIGKTEISLENIREFANQIPDNPDIKRNILIVGDPTKIANHLEVIKVLRELEEKGIGIVFHSTQPMTVGKVTGGEILELNEKYNHSFSGTVKGINSDLSESLKLLSETFKGFEKDIKGRKIIFDSINNKKHIPIKGKSSKKGKNNPQSGSNFHK